MQSRSIRLLFGASLFTVMSCAAIAGISDLSVDECAGGACEDSAVTIPDTGTPVDPDSGNVEEDAQLTPCPEGRGPQQVRVGRPERSFCIDSTEVTIGQYREFLQSFADAAAPTQIAECTWNTSLIPNQKTGTDDQPVAGVDWCDAYTYCTWAGKRLCGRITPESDGGTTVTADDYYRPSVNAWLAACAHDEDNRPFPYGSYETGRCNDGSLDAGGALPVGSLPRCEGSYPGIKDLSGNVWEWIDGCRTANKDAGPRADDCVFHGGAYSRAATDQPVPCTTLAGSTRDLRVLDVGFRCCSL